MRAEVVKRWKKKWEAGEKKRRWQQKNDGGLKDERRRWRCDGCGSWIWAISGGEGSWN